MFHVVLCSLEARAALIRHLSSHGVNAIFHYQALHLSSMGRRFGGKEGDCPVVEIVSDRLLRLPFYNDMDEMDQARVVKQSRVVRASIKRPISVEHQPRRVMTKRSSSAVR